MYLLISDKWVPVKLTMTNLLRLQQCLMIGRISPFSQVISKLTVLCDKQYVNKYTAWCTVLLYDQPSNGWHLHGVNASSLILSYDFFLAVDKTQFCLNKNKNNKTWFFFTLDVYDDYQVYKPQTSVNTGKGEEFIFAGWTYWVDGGERSTRMECFAETPQRKKYMYI